MDVSGGLQRLAKSILANSVRRKRSWIIESPAATVLDYRDLPLSRWELFSIHISPSFPTQFLQMLAVESAVGSFPNTSVPSGFSVFCWGFL